MHAIERGENATNVNYFSPMTLHICTPSCSILRSLRTKNMGKVRDRCADTTTGVSGTTVEAWGQGFMAGGLIVLMLLTLGSLRRHALLHKLILIELILAFFRGTYIFFNGPAAGYYSSSTSVLLYISYNLHNFINWIKIKPFLGKTGRWIYLGTLIVVWPYWIAEMYFIYEYNSPQGNDYFMHLRPWEFLCREPWWLFTTGYLIYIIKRAYDCSIIHLVRTSGKFLVLLVAMALSIVFIVADFIVVIVVDTPCRGKNPIWKVGAKNSTFKRYHADITDFVYSQVYCRRYFLRRLQIST